MATVWTNLADHLESGAPLGCRAEDAIAVQRIPGGDRCLRRRSSARQGSGCRMMTPSGRLLVAGRDEDVLDCCVDHDSY